MRNPVTILIDARLRTHPKRGVYRLKRTIGRGFVVKRRRTRAGIWGFTLMVGGVGGLTWGNLFHFSPTVIGCVAVLCGVMLLCSDWLNERSESHNASYRIGYDVGFDDGARNARQTAAPVVVPLRRECSCKKTAEVEDVPVVASVADRG